ncbi:glucosamine-6-phosphate deaminase [Aneurinibacillus terranovensis]|uniref:glucosamine-6-phosphate deaminase n=1 Tax=Aneurinibacillus terranovensis TaxID=278991 RepID=UPI000410E283|nr:glucosamine-6-phosphate deaminase [Aneurinibacillus terranovensis]
MDIVVTKSYEEMSQYAAAFLIRRMAKKGRVNIGLATGNTPTGMYSFLVQHLNLGYNIDNVHFYNIDEYCGVNGTENGTCTRYLQDNLFQKTEVIKKENIHWVHEGSYQTLDEEVGKQGGFDTVILGIGENGHIAYNEPGTPFSTLTHLVDLTDASKMQHSEEFGGYNNVPHKAVTVGVKTIMNAKNILLLANGPKKARILKEGLTGPITEEIPASVLQLHPNLYVFTDVEEVANL